MTQNSYIINNEIIFDKNTFELKTLADESEAITLNAPTARCLQLLIENKGEIVTRECFLEQVWHSRGVVVSENTFYQNISLLRKSLKKVSAREDIITTVRRKGFLISSDNQIQLVESEKSMLLTYPVDKIDVDEDKKALSFTADPITHDVAGNLPKDAKYLHFFQVKVAEKVKALLIIFIFLELISLMLALLKR